MEDWQYRFPHISKAEWLGKVNADLKGKSISTLQSEWWPGEIRHPLHHKEDITENPIHLPAHLFHTAPILSEWIDTRNRAASDINHDILQALQFGTQSLIIPIYGEPISFPKILDGVIEEYISLSVEVDPISTYDPGTIPDNFTIRHQRADMSIPDPSARFVFTISSEGTWTQQTAEIFDRVLQHPLLTGSYSSFLQHCVLRYTPGADFLKQIIQTRVIHIVWQRILDVYKVDSGMSYPYLECHIQPDKQNDPDKYLIRASSAALAASMTGVHSICIQHLSGDKPAYYERINRNIAHLLALESEMYKGVDPLAGSYAIDYYTRKWSDDILTSLRLIATA